MTLSANQLAAASARRKRLVKIAESLPEVMAQPVGHAAEHLAIKVRKKIFAYYQFDHHGDGMISLVCKSNHNEQRRLIRSEADTFFFPGYVGTKGWIGMRLDLTEVDWETVTELLRSAYQAAAPRKLAALVE